MAELPVPQLLDRLASGDTLAAIAADYNIHPSTLYRLFLRAGGESAYYEAKVAAHQARIWHADHALETASDSLEFNKAHARAKLSRLDYERTCPNEYGPKQEIQQDTTIRVVIEPAKPVQLRTPDTQVIDSNVSDIMDAEISG